MAELSKKYEEDLIEQTQKLLDHWRHLHDYELILVQSGYERAPLGMVQYRLNFIEKNAKNITEIEKALFYANHTIVCMMTTDQKQYALPSIIAGVLRLNKSRRIHY